MAGVAVLASESGGVLEGPGAPIGVCVLVGVAGTGVCVDETAGHEGWVMQGR